ncbi:hypothetical protein [Thauera linaloolentis]|uniref:Uncharacterized protein n=1 Tax=Thauera linaloolentis (strain DSM 12138 / JCM 21573 / CCUG 41526 / CIP 105981 / IAM 15112 / NBRC 102519 / 47Lol) TaxID=1123367 RepID=N6Z7B3_THAL4|nr:hypothetical protein [Thauera linaloolentis]ENO90437.1 hypothetical protein C666_00995 [Thauera linaloolentis 47Lol = DSM 12138]MCM8566298.1 hypothetical protein [Thauera linaloolentis]
MNDDDIFRGISPSYGESADQATDDFEKAVETLMKEFPSHGEASIKHLLKAIWDDLYRDSRQFVNTENLVEEYKEKYGSS